MIEIVPSIIAKNNAELNEKIKIVKGLCKRVQIDIMDGRFVRQKTVLPEDIKIRHKIATELHLMVNQPEAYLDECFRLKPKRIIFHVGSTKKPNEVIAEIKKRKIKVGLALNPEIKVSQVKNYIQKVDFIQLMTVHPGKYGARFLPNVLNKIGEIKKIRNIPVEVDGGMNKDTICAAIANHADIVGAGSAIFKVRNAEHALKEMKAFARRC